MFLFCNPITQHAPLLPSVTQHARLFLFHWAYGSFLDPFLDLGCFFFFSPALVLTPVRLPAPQAAAALVSAAVAPTVTFHDTQHTLINKLLTLYSHSRQFTFQLLLRDLNSFSKCTKTTKAIKIVQAHQENHSAWIIILHKPLNGSV